jgi:energy-coupling factor transport system ATP-binding protein
MGHSAIMSLIKLENVSYIYPRSKIKSLKGINLTIMEGEFLVVMGASGAGKTTLCKLVNGIIPHSQGGNLQGTVSIDGIHTDKSTVPRLAMLVGMAFDDPDAQLFTSTVRGEAAFGPENQLLPPQEIEDRVKDALAAVALGGFENRPPKTLSGGEKQRLVIAAALSQRGKILVLDEPLCRLDPQGASEVMAVINNIRQKNKLTVIMTTHDSVVASEYADRVCILKEGSITALDTPKNIFNNLALLEDAAIQPLAETEEFPAGFHLSHEFRAEEGLQADLPLKKPVIEISNFSFSYDKSINCIENLNLSIRDNDFVGIMGSNGCGKTTLLKNITGLLFPSCGDIFIHGKNTKNLSITDISCEIGFVMQNPDNQLFTDSVCNEVAFALKNMRLSRDEIKQRTQDALDTVCLDDKEAFPPALSRADRTRAVIACVLAMGCKILIFDEVDVGQDYHGSRHIMNIARELHSKGYTIIFVTHNISLAQEYARRLIIMHKNSITQYEK